MRRNAIFHVAVPLIAVAVLPRPGAAQAPAPGAVPAASPPAPPATGTYRDNRNGAHTWRVSASHAMEWDGAPWLPVGVVFRPKSWSAADGAAWDADRSAIAALKAHNVADVLIDGDYRLCDVPSDRVSRLLNEFDTAGIRYGLSFGASGLPALSGTVVNPAMYRDADTRDNLSAAWRVDDADEGVFVLTDVSNDNTVIRTALLKSAAGVLSGPVDAPASAGRVIALLYPHRRMTGAKSFPGVWDGFDSFRDQLISWLSTFKPGPGFRFMLDPLGDSVGLNGDADFLVPDSQVFAVEWESFLRRKYPGVEDVHIAWNLGEGEFKTFGEMARLIPLWANVSGVPYLYDRQSGNRYRVINAQQSTWWADYLQYRNAALRRYMDAAAAVIKRAVDVPVVYRWTQAHPIFESTGAALGSDGTAVTVAGTDAFPQSLGPAYGAVLTSPRAEWCCAVAQPAPGTASDAAALPATLRQNLLEAHAAGWKGFYADSGSVSPWSDADLTVLMSAEGRLTRDPSFVPGILQYPLGSPGPARTGPVPGVPDILWVGTLAPGAEADWWPSFSGYVMPRTDDVTSTDTVMVSFTGRRLTHFWIAGGATGASIDVKRISATTADGTPVPIKILGKAEIAVTLDRSPTVIRTPAYKLVPQEAAEDSVAQATALLQLAIAHKAQFVDSERLPLDNAAFELKKHDYDGAYTLSRTTLDELIELERPYIWIEAESTRVSTFNEVAYNAEASGKAFLRLNTTADPGRLGYAARWYFDVPEDGVYNVWLACTLPGPDTSPIDWKVNADPEQRPAAIVPPQVRYANGRFGWMKLGTATLTKGTGQSVSIFVTGRSPGGSWTFGADAIFLTREPLVPDGTARPMPVIFGTPGRGHT